MKMCGMFANENGSLYSKILTMHDKIITKRKMKYHPTGSRELETAE
jgi:hypothetical protein